MSEENIENITKSDSNLAPTFIDHILLPDRNFNGHGLIKNDISFPKKAMNLYISYTINPQLRNPNTDFTLGNCFSGSLKLAKNIDSGYGIGFDSRSKFLSADGSFGEKGIIFGADMSSSVHIDNKGKDILILGEGPTQGLDDTTLTAETNYPIIFTQSGKIFVLSLH